MSYDRKVTATDLINALLNDINGDIDLVINRNETDPKPHAVMNTIYIRGQKHVKVGNKICIYEKDTEVFDEDTAIACVPVNRVKRVMVEKVNHPRRVIDLGCRSHPIDFKNNNANTYLIIGDVDAF